MGIEPWTSPKGEARNFVFLLLAYAFVEVSRIMSTGQSSKESA
jgi:hypothetical protein